MVERLSRNPRVFIAFAVVLALIVAGLVYLLLNNATKNAAPPVVGGNGGVAVITPTVQLKEVVALADVPPYTVLNSSVVIDKYFQETPLPAGTTLVTDSFGSMQDFLDYLGTGHPGRYTSAFIVAGQQVRKTELADLNGRQAFSLSLDMPKQRVAESVSVAQVASVNQGVQAGDQVDVLLSVPPDFLYNYRNSAQQAGPQEESQTLLQNIPVLAAAPPIYTLMLTHQDAVVLKFVKDTQNATIELVLRSWLDPSAKNFKTNPVLPAYLAKSLTTNFTVPATPQPWPTVAPTGR